MRTGLVPCQLLHDRSLAELHVQQPGLQARYVVMKTSSDHASATGPNYWLVLAVSKLAAESSGAVLVVTLMLSPAISCARAIGRPEPVSLCVESAPSLSHVVLCPCSPQDLQPQQWTLQAQQASAPSGVSFVAL